MNRKSVKARFVPYDVIAGILALVKGKYLASSRRKIHQAICELRKSHQLLKCFPFDQDSFSCVLGESLDLLELSRLMTGESPDFRRLVLDPKHQKRIYQKLPQHFNDAQIKELQQIAQEFEERCKSSFER
ncbi:hypothetical protein D4R86_00675 [bacterium]|nr:MAG: hypothetical protein D4R86_00675 [bacterium]